VGSFALHILTQPRHRHVQGAGSWVASDFSKRFRLDSGEQFRIWDNGGMDNGPGVPKAKLDRKRIAGWLAAIVLSIWIPVAIDQAYFRYNAYILPVIGLVAAILYAFLIITSPNIAKKIHSFHSSFGTVHPWNYLAVIGASGAIIVVVLGIGEWYAIRKSKEHVATLKKTDLLTDKAGTAKVLPAPGPSESKSEPPAQPTKRAENKQALPGQKRAGLPKPSTASRSRNVVAPQLAKAEEPPSNKPADSKEILTSENAAVGSVIVQPGGAVSFNQQGGETAGTINHFGPLPPTLTWRQEQNKDAANTTIVTLSVDHSLEIPAFVAWCDHPCTSIAAYPDLSTISPNYKIFWYESDPTIVGITLTSPRPLGAALKVMWSIQSKDERPVIIKKVSILPEDRAKNL